MTFIDHVASKQSWESVESGQAKVALNTTGKFQNLLLMAGKKREINPIYRVGKHGKHAATLTSKEVLGFCYYMAFPVVFDHYFRCRGDTVPVNVTGLNHAILNQAEIPAALPIKELQT